MLPQVSRRFIDSEAWPHRCQFHNMPIGIVGVDAFEVHTIQYRCNTQTGLDQLFAPHQLHLLVSHGEREVMRLTRADLRVARSDRVAFKVGNQRAWASIAHPPVPVSRGGIVKVGSHLHSSHAEQIAKEALRAPYIPANGGDMMHTLTQSHTTPDSPHRLTPRVGNDNSPHAA